MGNQKRPLPDTKPEIATTNSTSIPLTKPIDSSLDDYDNPPTLDRVASSSSQPKSRAGWHGGTWPRKSAASTQVAREIILADKPKSTAMTTDLARFESRGLASEQRQAEVMQSPPLAGSSMVLEGAATSKHKGATNLPTTQSIISPAPTENKSKGTQISNNSSNAIRQPNLEVDSASSRVDKDAEDLHHHMTASTWRDWLGLSSWSSQRVDTESSQINEHSPAEPLAECLKTTSQESADDAASSTSWFGLWPRSAASPNMPDKFIRDEHVPVKDSIDSSAEGDSRAENSEPPSGSTWAFWSKDLGRSAAKAGSPNVQGELAITGDPSQRNPAVAHTENVRSTNVTSGDIVKQVKQTASPEITSSTPNVQSAEDVGTPSIQVSTKPKSLAPNLLLPPFRSTYDLEKRPSLIQQLTKFILHGRREPQKHICIAEAPRVRKALAIGIHGLFPAPLLRTVIGHPTGTSIRFANHAADAIHRWADRQGYSCDSVEKIALEGEGRIAERVDNLWRLLLNWIDHVRTADFIMIACHSQGVPVALMLVAKLIEFGVASKARIGICAMAGVSLGPFADYKSRLFSGSAAELFEFANSKCEVARRYQKSLIMALNFGVRVTYVGSIDDQLVSLESAIFSPINHPYIYRAVFVDGRVHAPDFITHLVGFALKLRNLGISDHGLIRELSAPLAGSLYSGGGHSSLYDETRIYDLAIEFALETSSVDDVPLVIQEYEVPTSSNPFQLPWSMRGLLEENLVKTELDLETKELLRQFDRWKPTTKVLKDVKYRLEAVKSKL